MKTFNYFSAKNFLLTIAAILVVAMGYMAITTYIKTQVVEPMTYEQEVQKIESQSNSDSTTAIEKDISETDLDDVDKELQDIETELNSTSL